MGLSDPNPPWNEKKRKKFSFWYRSEWTVGPFLAMNHSFVGGKVGMTWRMTSMEEEQERWNPRNLQTSESAMQNLPTCSFQVSWSIYVSSILMSNKKTIMLTILGINRTFLLKEEYYKATAISCTGNVTLPQLQLLCSTSLCGWEGMKVFWHIKFVCMIQK